jgi:peptidyl-prolyl cis-trans isomerase C
MLAAPYRPAPYRRLVLPALCALGLAACGGGTSSSGSDAVIQLKAAPSVAVINGQDVPQALLEALAKQRQLDLSKPEDYEKAFKELSEYVLLAQEARREKLAEDTAYAANVEVGRLQAVANASVLALRAKAQIDPSILMADYEDQLTKVGKFNYDLTQLVFATEDEALKAAGEVVAGKPFGTVFNEYNGSARQARSFAQMRLPQLPPAIAAALQTLKAGETMKVPIQTQAGWHLIHVDKIEPFVPPPFERVRDAIRERMATQLIDERVAKLREEADIKLTGQAPGPAAPAVPAADAKPAGADGKKD